MSLAWTLPCPPDFPMGDLAMGSLTGDQSILTDRAGVARLTQQSTGKEPGLGGRGSAGSSGIQRDTACKESEAQTR